jgi:pyruvate-ferredoxin/flavodoxin oxidoreductase
MVPHDGNSACAHVAHAMNEVIAIYPITPSSALGEISDEKSSKGETNIWGTVPRVEQLQSEAGAAGAVHGALSAGTLTTTFTASQGLLLMIPNMYKIAGELLPTVFHVTSRSLACQALSIFGDHSDVMAVRQTGFAMLSSSSVQEAMDFALIAQAATLESRIPFVHFYEGFRVSSEIQKIAEISKDDIRAMIKDDQVRAHRARAMSPDHPTVRGTSQNPDVYFQGRETVNSYYQSCPAIVQQKMDEFAKLTGRQYKLFEYIGAPDAEKVIVIMGCGGETVHETVEYLNEKSDAKVGVVKVRLYRPFNVEAFVNALPATVKKIAVLDRTKEPGSLGEPLYEDVRTAIGEAMMDGTAQFDGYPVTVGGRYGLGSAEFTPAMVKGVFDELDASKPKNHFSVGINDDVTNNSIVYDPTFSIEGEDIFRAMFYGLGADGTVGANKNSIKIIGSETDNYAQGYFVYDSKKSGAVTTSHLRFGPRPIRRPYLISRANFIACHNFSFLEKFDMLSNLEDGGIFLLTSEYDKDTVWNYLPGRVQKQIIDKKLQFFVIDAIQIAMDIGLGPRINVIMQTAFFHISKIMQEIAAVKAIKDAIQKTYGKKGEQIVTMNNKAVDEALSNIHKVDYPSEVTNPVEAIEPVSSDAPEFVRDVTAKFLKQEGHTLPVSKMPADGAWPTGTTKYEKRNIAVQIPVWNPEACIQCHQCSLVCPHGTIRPKAYEEKHLENAPAEFKSTDAKGKDLAGLKYTLQIAPEDCTGCGACVETCPAKAKGAISMQPQTPLRDRERQNWEFFQSLPETDPSRYNVATIKGSQFVTPLFEFSGACAGCGETAYVKLMSQLFGDRALIANATGCSSIYGGNLPTTPYTLRADGRGPAWNNSLFEDCAELAFGMRMAVDKFNEYATELARKLIADGEISAEAKAALGEIIAAEQKTTADVETQRARIEKARAELSGASSQAAKELLNIIDYLAKKSVWALGGDGWAYDIGYGGVDHVLASGKNVNVLVLDTEVYSNTGGQSSKSTPMGAVAKFAASGKPTMKKDMGLIAMSYGYIYVAKVAMAANMNQAVKAFIEAEAYDGPSLILCYAQCIAQGINMTKGYEEQKLAVNSGHWPLYRYNPSLAADGKNPLQLDSRDPKIPLSDYVYNENRYKILQRSKPEISKDLVEKAQKVVEERFKYLKELAAQQS